MFLLLLSIVLRCNTIDNNSATSICCIYTCNVACAGSEVMVGDTCIPSLIIIGTAINQLKTNVSLITICCLRLFVVVYKLVTF